MEKLKKIEGAIINGVKYNRETDFSRDDTKGLLRKFKKYADYQGKITEILKRRLVKLEEKGAQNEELIKSIKELLNH
jgi:hypothetical protein